MKIDVIAFLTDQGIEFVEHPSVNVARGNVNIKCPFCGPNDPSHHLGINLETAAWGCWRDPAHRGRSFRRLIQHVLNKHPLVVDTLLEEYDASRNDEGLDNLFAEDPEGDAARVHIRDGALWVETVFPTQVRRLVCKNFHEEKFLYYLGTRGYSRRDLPALINRYDLHYAISGRYSDRVVLPVKRDGKLLTWTGRSVYPTAEVRYLSASDEVDGTRTSIKDCLFNFDHAALEGNSDQLLYVVEGPFDAMKVDYFAWKNQAPARCVALFNTSMSTQQSIDLADLSIRYRAVVFLFDKDAMPQALKAMDALAPMAQCGVVARSLSEAKDPGDLTENQITRMVERDVEASE